MYYDLAISFAGADRRVAKALTKHFLDFGFMVFYDEFEQASLVGKNLYEYLQEIYRENCSYPVILVSENFRKSRWATHEWRSAQAKAWENPGSDAVIPVILDDTQLPGLLPTLGYLDYRKLGAKKTAALIAEKVKDVSSLNEITRRAADAHTKQEYALAVQISSDPRAADHLPAIRVRSHALARLGKYEEAISAIQRLLVDTPRDSLLHFRLGSYHLCLRQFAQALEHYEIAHELDPMHPTIAEDLEVARSFASGKYMGRDIVHQVCPNCNHKFRIM